MTPALRRLARLAALASALACPLLQAGTTTLAPQGAFAQVDTRLANETVDVLTKGTDAQKRSAIERVKQSPQDFAPPVFYAMSRVLFERGDKDEAAFWFYAGQLRGRFDANRCLDASARQAIGALNQAYGKPINLYAFEDLAKLEALVPRVVEWDRRTPHHYDHRWINLHGMGAVLSGLGGPAVGAPAAMSAPEEAWEAIAEKTRADYLRGFSHVVAQIRSRIK